MRLSKHIKKRYLLGLLTLLLTMASIKELSAGIRADHSGFSDNVISKIALTKNRINASDTPYLYNGFSLSEIVAMKLKISKIPYASEKNWNTIYRFGTSKPSDIPFLELGAKATRGAHREKDQLIAGTADLKITKLSQDGSGVVLAGDQITYTIKVKNAGPDAANGALFTFDLPAGFQTTAADISFNANGCGSKIGGLNYNPAKNSFSVKLNLPSGCEVTYRFKVEATTNVALGKNEFVASILRPSGVVDPDATNQTGQPPTDPFDECAQNGQGGNCNNIKRNSVLYSTGCFISVAGEGFSWSYNGSETMIEKTIIQPSTSAGFTFDIYELDNSFNMKINGVLLATEEIQFQSDGTNGINVQFADGENYEDEVNDIWNLEGNAANPLIRVKIDPNGNVSMYGSKVSEGILYPLVLINGNSFNTVPWDLGAADNTIKVSQKVTGPTVMRGYGYGTNAAPCTYSMQKEGIFNDANNNGYAEVGELITYTFTVDNENDVPIYDVVLNDPLLGGNLNAQPIGDNNNDQILNISETWTYTVNYAITQNDINNGGVYNRATVSGKDDANIPYDPKLSEDPTPYTLGEAGYDPNRPYHTFVPLKPGSFTITNPMIYQMIKNQ